MIQVKNKTFFSNKSKYWDNRWDNYLKDVAAIVSKLDVTKVLEVGTNGISLCIGSETLDIKEGATYHYSITDTPLPFEDKNFDLIIATQVWEHLEGGQQRAFKEVLRLSKYFVMSVPYMWEKSAHKSHIGITKDIINDWTLNYPYQIEMIVGKKKKRLIRLYKFN